MEYVCATSCPCNINMDMDMGIDTDIKMDIDIDILRKIENRKITKAHRWAP
jgi:hypothetical protein